MSVLDWIFELLYVIATLGFLLAVLAVIGVFGLSAALAVILVLYALRKEKREWYKKALKVLLTIMGAFLAAGFLCTVIYTIAYLLD